MRREMERIMSDLYKKLIEYSESDYYPFHMPGHKRNMKEGVNPYSYDITEIDGFDNLHDPKGVLRIAMEEAAKFYETDKTYFLINGSTCGLLAAISGVTHRGDQILVARNCHKSVYNAMDLRGLMPIYIYPDYIEKYGISGGISPDDVEKALEENPMIKAVIITSPTYEGVVSDVAKIAEIVHRKRIPFIVDEAHGAHFSMHPQFPKSAVSLGADIIIQSLHKTLPSLTQTALLHIKSNIVNPKDVEKFLRIYQTTSPSYVLMASIDECIHIIRDDSILLFEAYAKRLEVVAQHVHQLTHLKMVGKEIIGRNHVFDFDCSKIVISVRGTSYSGKKLYDEMRNRFHLQLEMASGDYAIAMTSPMDTEEGLLRLFSAMVEIDRDIRVYGDDLPKEEIIRYQQPKAIVIKSIAQIEECKKETLEINRSAGRVSAEFVYLYPPGIPIIAPGEMITNDCIDLIMSYKKAGLTIHGTEWNQAEKISVIQEDFKRINLTNLF